MRLEISFFSACNQSASASKREREIEKRERDKEKEKLNRKMEEVVLEGKHLVPKEKKIEEDGKRLALRYSCSHRGHGYRLHRVTLMKKER